MTQHNSCYLSKEVKFQEVYYFHTLKLVWMKNAIQMFYVRSHEYNFSYAIEMVHNLIHIQSMTKYFINFRMVFGIHLCSEIYLLFNYLIDQSRI